MDITALTSVILLRALAQMDSHMQLSMVPPAPTPRTPTWQGKDSDVASSPPIHSPNQLTRFLQYAETSLGVPDALSYQDILEQKGIGPDVFHDFDNKFYADLGILPGDIVRLKKDSGSWWKALQAEVKRKRSESEAIPPSQPRPLWNQASRLPNEWHMRSGMMIEVAIASPAH
jgi:hypothetical protein